MSYDPDTARDAGHARGVQEANARADRLKLLRPATPEALHEAAREHASAWLAMAFQEHYDAYAAAYQAGYRQAESKRLRRARAARASSKGEVFC